MPLAAVNVGDSVQQGLDSLFGFLPTSSASWSSCSSATSSPGSPARRSPRSCRRSGSTGPCLAGALAFGLGGREVAAELLRGAYVSGQENKDQVQRDLQRGRQRTEQEADRHGVDEDSGRDDASSRPTAATQRI